jgi:hypothetical protein
MVFEALTRPAGNFIQKEQAAQKTIPCPWIPERYPTGYRYPGKAIQLQMKTPLFTFSIIQYLYKGDELPQGIFEVTNC